MIAARSTMIAALCGADGAGKSKHAASIGEWAGWTKFGFPDRTTPMGTLIGAHLKGSWAARSEGPTQLAKGEVYSEDVTRVWEQHVNAHVFQALQTVNRLEKLPAMQAALAQGKNLILDRYWPSAVVYGGFDGIDESYLVGLHASLPQPDLFILLDVDLEQAKARRETKGGETYEKLDKMRERLIAGYRALWAKAAAAGWPGRWVKVDARGSFVHVHAQLKELLRG